MPAKKTQPVVASPGWRLVEVVHFPLEDAKRSGADYKDPDGALIRKAFMKIWQSYTKSLRGRRLGVLRVTVHPRWLKAAKESPEMDGIIGKLPNNSRLVLIYGLNVVTNPKSSVDKLTVEEEIEKT